MKCAIMPNMRQILAVIMSFAVFFFSFDLHAAPASDDVSLGIAGATLGKISPMNEGQKAPFDGVLLDASAAARLMVEQQEADNKCRIETEKQVSTAKAKLELDLANMRASRDSLKKELEVRVNLKDEHIEFLEKHAVRNAKKANNGKWWLVGGIAVGIALTVGGAFLIREIRSDQPIIINTTGAQ